MKETKLILQIGNDNMYIDTFVYDAYKSLIAYNTFNTIYKYSYLNLLLEDLKNINKLEEYTPVGSVDFVTEYLRLINIEIPKPLNVPLELRKYCSRDIYDINKKDLINNIDIYNNFYIKSNEFYKAFEINKVKYIDNEILKYENFFISSEIKSDIVSEFRCFILSDRIISINNYIGDCLGLTDNHINLLKEFILKIKNLRSYTIDFAVLENNKIEIIELHHGYSCGNYGFKGDKYLSFLINGINQLKINK